MILKEQSCPTCSSLLRGSGGISYCPHCLMTNSLGGLQSEGQVHPPTLIDPEEIQLSFSDFEILSFAGAGGMGLVYKALDKKLGREVALKIVPDNIANPEFGERFEREARSLARLNHPDFVQIYEHGQVDGWFYIAMEFVDGKDLGQVLKESGHLAPAKIQRQISQLLESLSLAHQQGVIHRDLKPANLIVAGDRLKVADFGLAKLQENEDYALSLTGDETALGTPYYIAPEQRDGSPDVDHRADLYSIGVILYQAVTGTLPIGQYEPASKLAAVSSGFDRVISKALQPRPSQRFQSAEEMKRALDGSSKKSIRLLWVTALLLISGLGLWQIFAKSPSEDPPSTQLDRANGFLLDQPGTKVLRAPKGTPDYFGNFTVAGENWLMIGAPDKGFFEGEADEPGKVFIYRLDEGNPILHQTLLSPNPVVGDQFGGILSLAPWENTLAVSSNDEEGAAVYYFYTLDENDRWSSHQTLELDLERPIEDIPPRVVFGTEEMIVTSPGSTPEEALILFEKDSSGFWKRGEVIISKTKTNDKAKLGFQAMFHEDQLFVTAFGYNKGLSLRSGGLLVFQKVEDQWQEVQFLEKPSSQAFEYFGFDFTFAKHDRLLVSGIMTKFQDLSSAGSLSEFHRDQDGNWKFVAQIDPQEPEENQKLFGQQILTIGETGLAFSALGSIKEPDLQRVQSRVHLLQKNDDGFWNETLRLDSEGKGDTWLGRATTIPGNFVIPNPGKNEVYLLPVR